MKAVNLLLPLLLLPVLSAARAQSALPDAVERAIAEAEALSDPQQRWAFTRTYTRNGDTIVARYDPRRPAREQWRLTTPSSEDALTKKQREMFRDLEAESGAMADRAVMIRPSEEPGDGLRYLMSDLTLIADGPSGKRYAFGWPEVLPAGADEEHRWLMKHVDGEFAVAADEPWLFSIRLFAPEPFGIGGVVRVTSSKTPLNTAKSSRAGRLQPSATIITRLGGFS